MHLSFFPLLHLKDDNVAGCADNFGTLSSWIQNAYIWLLWYWPETHDLSQADSLILSLLISSIFFLQAYTASAVCLTHLFSLL